MPGHDDSAPMPPPSGHPTLRWDLFCRVIDNFGDLGVCHRTARHLAALGQCVRLWVDDAALMARMAPETPPATEAFWQAGAPGVAWVHWAPLADDTLAPGDVVVEAFGCDPPPGFVARMAARAASPVWVNLEYLSAEGYVARSHGLASPQSSGPGQGLTKWFFYPGFSRDTGGLLREAGLAARRAAFDRCAWLQGLGLPSSGARVISLFAYESAPLEPLMDSLVGDGVPTRLLVTHGPLQARALDWARQRGLDASSLQVSALPWLSGEDFDHLLWSTDLNFVRGEDSLVRALWAGVPFIWQLYPQQDGAHAAKLNAFWRWLNHAGNSQVDGWPVAWWPWWAAWNGLGPRPDTLPWHTLAAWGRDLQTARAALACQPPLADALLQFVAGKRGTG